MWIKKSLWVRFLGGKMARRKGGERAGAGELRLSELTALFWHCLRDRPEALTRDAFGDAVAAQGLTAALPALKVLLGQILAGR